jgi:hypothetical protein
MNRVGIAGIVVLVVALAACNPTPNQDPGTPDPGEGQPPLVTPVGTNVGNPVTQPITATGGTLTAGGVTVSAPAGAFSSANLSVQPITGTLNGTGQGIAISSDAAWGKYLTVTFPIEATDEYPDGLGLAIQQKDGSWLSLEPVKVDKVAGTVGAGLLAPLSATSAGLRTQGGVEWEWRVEKFEKFFMKPSSARVRVKEKQSFTPWARVGDFNCLYAVSGKNDSELASRAKRSIAVLEPEGWLHPAVVGEWQTWRCRHGRHDQRFHHRQNWRNVHCTREQAQPGEGDCDLREYQHQNGLEPRRSSANR